MKQTFLKILPLLFCAVLIAGCSNLVDELTPKFEPQNTTQSPVADHPFGTLMDATSADTGIVTITANDDGTITLTSVATGTTSVTVTGTRTDSETGKTYQTTIVYDVTVGQYGAITINKKSEAVSEAITLTPQGSGTSVTAESATSADETVATAIKNADGTVTFVAQNAGKTTVTVTGTDANGDAVTLTYNVTVAEDGTITVGEPTVFTNESKKIDPKKDENLSKITSATDDPSGIFTLTENDDGTYTVTAQKAGTTTITVTGTNAGGDTILVTYAVTVSDTGALTVETPTVKTVCTVTFSTGGGSTVETQTVEKGAKATRPEIIPTKDGYRFGGWFTSDDGGSTLSETAFDFDTAIDKNITLYAKWAAIYTVKLTGGKNACQIMGGDTTQSVAEGEEMQSVGYYYWTLVAEKPTYSFENFTTITNNGITVTYSETGRSITVSGKPTGNTEIYIPDANIVDLSNQDLSDFTVQDGDVLINTLNLGRVSNRRIRVADGATVTLKGATINGSTTGGGYAGLTCLGNATIILEGENAVKGFGEHYSGIYIAPNRTLTIKGDGSLTASSSGKGAGIGAGYGFECGNIAIEGGTITATGGEYGAGIGASGVLTSDTGYKSYGNCGNITIKGGTVNATGGKNAAGIGGSESDSNCGDITITGGTVTATKGEGATNSIGKGDSGVCGTVTIGGTVYYNGSSYQNDGESYLATSPLTYSAQ